MDTPTPDNLESKILSMLDKKLMSVSQIAREMKISRGVATGYLEALRNQGKLEMFKVGRSNVYIVRGVRR